MIVGAGPVGTTLANLLGVYGVRTCVLERHSAIYDSPRAVAIDDEAMRAWQAAGLADRIVGDLSMPVHDEPWMRYRDARGEMFMGLHRFREPYGYPGVSGFIQPLTERALVDGLSRFGHVDLRFGHEVQEVEGDGGSVRVTGTTSDGATFTVDADYLVACDGGQSAVRRVLGIPMVGSTYRQRWLVIDTMEDGPGHDCSELQIDVWCDPRRPTVTVPRRHGHRRWEFMLHRDEREQDVLTDTAIRSMLRARGVSETTRILRRLVYTFNARIADRYRSGRILLAGDAAHVTPPFAGQGLSSGVRDAFNLAWKLAMVVKGDATPSLLDSYERERRGHQKKMIRLAKHLGYAMMPRNNAQAVLMIGSVKLARKIPPLRRFLERGGPRVEPHYRASRGRVVARCWGRPQIVGHYLIQPSVGACPIGVHTSYACLDDALGRGFAVIGFLIDPRTMLSEENLVFWQDLDARFVRIVRSSAVSDVSTVTTIGDRDGMFEDWLGSKPRILVVRPDRFIAAEVSPSRADAATASMRDLL